MQSRDMSLPNCCLTKVTAPSLRSPKPSNMSVVVLFRRQGDPDELLAAYDRGFVHSVPRDQPLTATVKSTDPNASWIRLPAITF